jgi:hypothetical protein
MMTFSFNYIPLTSTSNSIRYKFLTNDAWNQYYKVYKDILSNLNKNYHKKRYIQPLTFDFLDVNGTRDSQCACFTERTIPHIHSIYLVHEETLQRFQRLIDTNFKAVIEHEANRLNSIESKPITDLPKAVSYCSKFLDTYQARSLRENANYVFFNQFPMPASEKQVSREER